MRPLLSLLLLSALSAWAANPATDAVNRGGVRIFRSVAEKPGNVCLSPFSIQSALAMTYVGASGVTKSEMASVLFFPDSADELAAGFQSLNKEIRESVNGAGKDTTLNIANRLFGATGFEFRTAFLRTVAASFDAPLQETNFQANPSAAAAKINAWVEQQTAERIKNLIPDGALTKDTTLVLVNALYLKTPWAEEFAKTADLAFRTAPDVRRNVPAIGVTQSFGYSGDDGMTTVAVPFRGGQFQFVIFLPADDVDPALLTADRLVAAAKLPRRSVKLVLPKFRIEPPTMSLGDLLKALGMPQAFDVPPGSADFDAMAPRRPDDYLYISDVFHKTFFALDEKGVEAAAATAVVMMRALAMPLPADPIEVKVDRPFFFAVQHVPSGACLFLGRVTEPKTE